jgi:filamentous hemagglutinin
VDWSGYPAGVPKPDGPFRLIAGAEYEASRKAANTESRALRAQQGLGKTVQKHENAPVKFGGDPVAGSNKTVLDVNVHSQVTSWWNGLMRDIKASQW